MEYQLIPMEEKHLLTLAALERICFSDPWSENAFRAELDNPGARFTVAQGRAPERCWATWDCITCWTKVILPTLRWIRCSGGRGSGQRCWMTRRILPVRAGLAFLTLEVRQSNLGAQALYRRHGFCPAGVRKNYYRDPVEDAILMTRKLTEEESQK